MLTKKFFKTKDIVDVTFAIDRPEASSVELHCEANDWQPVPMEKGKKNGTFKAKLAIPKGGEFQFRYLVDGSTWENDEAADGYLPNEFGTDNSIVATGE